MRATSIVMGLCLIGIFSASAAANADSSLDRLLACRAVDDAEDRLKCFDEAASTAAAVAPVAVESALRARETEIIRREAELKAREAELASKTGATKADDEVTLFGVPLPFTKNDQLTQSAESGGAMVSRDEDGAVDSIRVAIKEWSYGADGRIVVVLANGQVWRQTDGRAPNLDKDKSNFVIVRRGAMSSFLMQVNGKGTGLRVKRVDGQRRR